MRIAVTILHREFFKRPVLKVAPDLLGKYLISKDVEAMITEVEAYDGPQDLACHGARERRGVPRPSGGYTERTKVMFGPAGYWYVYLCYGVHWMLNIVTGDEGYPSAVLLRGLKGLKRSKGLKGNDMCDGPGKLTAAFVINGLFNGKAADPSSGLWIEERGVAIRQNQITKTPRIGVAYAGAWADKPYRFVLRD